MGGGRCSTWPVPSYLPMEVVIHGGCPISTRKAWRGGAHSGVLYVHPKPVGPVLISSAIHQCRDPQCSRCLSSAGVAIRLAWEFSAPRASSNRGVPDLHNRALDRCHQYKPLLTSGKGYPSIHAPSFFARYISCNRKTSLATKLPKRQIRAPLCPRGGRKVSYEEPHAGTQSLGGELVKEAHMGHGGRSAGRDHRGRGLVSDRRGGMRAARVVSHRRADVLQNAKY